MHKYFFIENKLVFFDVDLAEHFGVYPSDVQYIYESNKNRFLKDTVFKVERFHITTAETLQDRIFEVAKPKFAFTKSAVFIMSMLIHTEQAIRSSMALLNEIEAKEESDIARAFAAFSNNISNKKNDDRDSAKEMKAFLKLLIIETLLEIKEERNNQKKI